MVLIDSSESLEWMMMSRKMLKIKLRVEFHLESGGSILELAEIFVFCFYCLVYLLYHRLLQVDRTTLSIIGEY